MGLERIVDKALAKDPGERYQNVNELPVDLKSVEMELSGTSLRMTKVHTKESAQISTHEYKKKLLKYSALSAVIASIVFGFLIWVVTRQAKPPPQSIRRYSILPSSPTGLFVPNTGLPISLSPDGRNLLYFASEGGEPGQFYVRPLERLEATPIPGTEGALFPFFSPDSRYVGYQSDNKLMKVLIDGGIPLEICELDPSEGFFGGTWDSDDTIYFGTLGGLKRVAASAGNPEFFTTIDTSEEEGLIHGVPKMLPENRGLVFTVANPSDLKSFRIALYSFNTKEWNVILDETGSHAHYVSTGHIVYMREDILMGMPFDLQKLEVTGSPEQVLDNKIWFGQFSVSSDGSLVYMPNLSSGKRPERSLVLVDRKGNEKLLTDLKQRYRNPRFSPDGKYIAIDIIEKNRESIDTENVWVFDMERSFFTQQTFETSNLDPIWTPDGKRLIFGSEEIDGTSKVYWKQVNSTEEPELLLEGNYPWITSLSPDGKVMAFYDRKDKTGLDIFTMDANDKTITPIANSPAEELSPMFSPDGRFIAYGSNESGQREIYVQPYPPTGRKWQISNDGGTEPVWAPNGKELFYRSGERMIAVSINTSPEFKPGIPQKLFEGKYRLYFTQGFAPGYDIHPDGDKFVMVKEEEAEENTQTRVQINVVLNWFEELMQRVSIKSKLK